MCAFGRVWTRGKSGVRVEWTKREEVPEAERRVVGVGARAKMSVGWAAVRVWIVRYCFDILARWGPGLGGFGGVVVVVERWWWVEMEYIWRSEIGAGLRMVEVWRTILFDGRIPLRMMRPQSVEASL